jgi:molybdopterin-guanine dinucleotide biosynthesis protein A
MIALRETFAICIPRIGNYHHPLAAVYRKDVTGAVRGLLAANRLKLLLLLEAVPAREVGAHELIDVDPTFASLQNVNSPEEYQAALRDLATEQNPLRPGKE